jgi:uncharacterized protein DUF4396
VHCLTGCAIGEVLGMVIGTGFGMSNALTIGISISLAFVFGYALTALPLLRSEIPPIQAATIALASDTASITSMEIVDNLVIVGVPGALEAGLDSVLFWGTLALSLGVAFVITVPVNRELLRRGKGHAAIHRIHEPRGRGIGPPSCSSAHSRSNQRKPERVLVPEGEGRGRSH